MRRTMICTAAVLLMQLGISTGSLGGSPAPTAPLHGVVSQVRLAAPLLRLQTVWNASFEGTVWIGFEKEGALYAALTMPVRRSEQQLFDLELPANLPVGSVTARVVPLDQPVAASATAVIEVAPDQAAPRPTALAWGIYRDAALHMHPWHVTAAGLMMWDGKPYIPFGGMFNLRSTWMTHVGEADNTQAAQVGADLAQKRFSLLKQYGLRDIFFNACFVRSNPNTLAEVIRLAETNGMRYGVHVSSMPSRTSKGFIRDEKNRQTIAAGATAAVVRVAVTADQIRPPQRCIWGLLSSRGELVESGAGLFDLSAQETPPKKKGDAPSMTLQVNLAFKTGVQAERTLVFLPELPLDPNDPSGYFEGIDDYIARVREFYGSLPLGPGLRLWLDPFQNEMHYPAINVCSAGPFRDGFVRWLRNKYGTVAALNQHWVCVKGPVIGDFNKAARLVPLCGNGGTCTWMDPDDATLCTVDAERTEALRDLAEYRGSVCERFVSTLADVLKGIANVPVILKHNVWISDWFANPNTTGGQDGVGYEPYCYGDSLAYHNSLVAYAEAQASARRQWTLVTETSPAAFDGQKDYVGYLDRLQLLDDMDQLLLFGAKGVFTFGFSFDPPSLFQVTELIRDVRQLEWLATYSKTVEAAAGRLGQYAPEVHGWYPAHLRERDILGQSPRAFEMDGHYTGVATQIRMAPDGRWIVPALRPDAGWHGLLIDGDLLTASQFDTAVALSGKQPVGFLSQGRAGRALPSTWKTAPLDGFTVNGIGVIPPSPRAMTLDQFRQQVLGYRVFQTVDLNGQTLPDNRLMVWACVERTNAMVVLPATATAADLAGRALPLEKTGDGRQRLSLTRLPYEKTTKNPPPYLGYGYYYPDHGQPEVAVLNGVGVDELLKLNPPAYLRWLPADVPPQHVAVWREAEETDETTFTQPRVEGYSRYSDGCGLGINTWFSPPSKQTWHARYGVTTSAIDAPQFWLRRMEKPALDVEVWVDGKRAGVIGKEDPVSDPLHLNPWNAGIGANNLRVGWCRLKLDALANGAHTIELVAVPSQQQQAAIDTKLMGAAAEKRIGAGSGERRLQCLQVDAWMIAR